MSLSHSWLNQAVASVLVLVTTLTSVAPLSAHAYEFAPVETQPSALQLEVERRQAKLKTYFEGCNNYISEELDAKGLRRDVGDRPTPIQMMGIGLEDKNSGGVKFDEIKRDVLREDKSRALLSAVYVESMKNTIHAYTRMMAEYQGYRPGAADIVKKVCAQGAGCHEAANDYLLREARDAVSAASTLRTYTHAEAAAAINAEVRQVNEILRQIRMRVSTGMLGSAIPPTPFQMHNYSAAFMQAATKAGPMRLLALPLINEKVGAMQTAIQNLGYQYVSMEFTIPSKPGVRFPAIWENGYGTTIRDKIYHLDQKDHYAFFVPHGYVTAEEVAKSIPEGLELIEGQIKDLNDSVALAKTGNYKAVQSSVGRIIGTNAFAAHVILVKDDSLAPSACRAFREFAIGRAKSHRSERRKANALQWLGTGLIVLAAVMPAAAYFGYLSVATAATILSTAGLVAGIIYELDSLASKPGAEKKVNLNMAAVLTGNISPEVIVTRIPRQLAERNQIRQDVYVNLLMLGFSAYFLFDDAKVSYRVFRGLQGLDPITKAALAQKEGIVSLKVAFQAFKLTPVMMKGLAYLDYKEFYKSEVRWEEDEGSGVFVVGRVDGFNDKYGTVKLTVISRTGPSGELPLEPPTIELSVDTFRNIIEGIR